MVFSSHIFLFVFLPLALLLYYGVPAKGRAVVLTLLSYVFYGWWNPWFTLLMLGSTLVDYGCGKLITANGQSESLRRLGMVVSVVVNLAVLGFFKYALFFSESIAVFSEWLGWGTVEGPEFLTRIVLPVGISFYTFQSMSYSIDLYRGHARPAPSLLTFACYVSMFPQLVAGPIVRYGWIADQLRSREHSVDRFLLGLTRLSLGFAKKILLANPMGSMADACFEAGPEALSAPLAWAGALAYALQIYFDFSGYSDMAIGLGLMFGFVFPENFDSPYKSRSVTEFWRRWHITLSSFLRDYLYIPLGGNRRGQLRTYVNLMLVMLIGGLWHGAQWTFVIWGGLHGLALALERLIRERTRWVAPSLLAAPVFLIFLMLTWVFFRAESLTVALSYLRAMIGLGEAGSSSLVLSAIIWRPYHMVALFAAVGVAGLLPNSAKFLRKLTVSKVILAAVLLLVSVRVLGLQGVNPFLYFQF
ncbi:MAG: MBOAT family protein [Verrucomicrobiota bacterium]